MNTQTHAVHTTLTVEEAAKELRISRTHMYELVQQGKVRSFKVGRCRRIQRCDLEQYIERRLALAGA